MQEFSSFDVVWLLVWVVKAGCSFVHSRGNILSIPSLFFENIIFLESWFGSFSKNAGLSSRFYSMLFL